MLTEWESKPDNRHAFFYTHVGQRCTSSRVGVRVYDVAEGALSTGVCRPRCDVLVADPVRGGRVCDRHAVRRLSRGHGAPSGGSIYPPVNNVSCKILASLCRGALDARPRELECLHPKDWAGHSVALDTVGPGDTRRSGGCSVRAPTCRTSSHVLADPGIGPRLMRLGIVRRNYTAWSVVVSIANGLRTVRGRRASHLGTGWRDSLCTGHWDRGVVTGTSVVDNRLLCTP